MKIIQLQMVFFYDSSTTVDFDGMSYFIRQTFKKKAGIELTNNMMLGVLPMDTPPEIPRLQLFSIDNKFRVQCSLQRCDLFFERMDSEQEVDLHLLQEVFDSVVDIHKELNKDIIRIGLVAVKAELNNNPNKEIVKNYLSNNMQNDSEIIEDINLMYNKKFEFEQSIFNCHLSIMSGYDIVREQPMLVKQIDVNTIESFIFKDKYTAEKTKKAFLSKVNEIQ